LWGEYHDSIANGCREVQESIDSLGDPLGAIIGLRVRQINGGYGLHVGVDVHGAAAWNILLTPAQPQH